MSAKLADGILIFLMDFFIRGIETIYKLQQNTFTSFALLKCKMISCPRLQQEVQNKIPEVEISEIERVVTGSEFFLSFNFHFNCVS